jgi:glycosyltransferase involved in cell wall biosynthesis
VESVAYIVSGIQKALAFEWVAEEWDWSRSNLSFILLNADTSPLEEWLRQQQVPVYRVSYRGKSDLPGAIRQVHTLLKKNKVGVVHCHLFEASLVGLLAARLARVPKRIYTRHYSTFHHVYFPRAVWYDKFINWLATDIIAICNNVSSTLVDLERVNPQKIHLVHHGFRLPIFQAPPAPTVSSLRLKYQTEGKYPVVGVISRYFELKGIHFVIPAFQQLLREYPDAKLILANAGGSYAPAIRQLLAALPAGSYREIPFEEEVGALYHLFDVFVHAPVNGHVEAFGQTYVEALAAGVPSVFTLSGVAPEFIVHGKNALVVPFESSEAIYLALKRIVEEKELAGRLREKGREDVQQLFPLQRMMKQLEQVYRPAESSKVRPTRQAL